MPLFSPKQTLSMVATDTSSSISLGRALGRPVRVQVIGLVPAFIKFAEGASASVSVDDGIPIMPGAPELFFIGNESYVPAVEISMAACTESSSTRVSVTLGTGDQ